jgi:hypothetical protein
MYTNFRKKYLEFCVYTKNVFADRFSILPGYQIADYISRACDTEDLDVWHLESKLNQSCRKLCLMWHASEQALVAEEDFYSVVIKDAPALFGEDAIKVHYHLEAMVLFARSALDIASFLFGWSLPDPFPRKRYDSFNDLIKNILKEEYRLSISEYFEKARSDELSWLSAIAGIDRGRSLRDKIAHQTEFPIDYKELNPPSEKESAIVRLGNGPDSFLPLGDFIEKLRTGVIEGYLCLEKLCADNLKTK